MKCKKISGAPCMSYFGTVSSLLQSVDSRGLWGDLTVAELGAGHKVEVRAKSNLVTLSTLCRPHQCVCVCVFSSHPFWTSSSLDVPAGVTQEEGHTGFLIHLPSAVRALFFVAGKIQPFLSLVDREVEFCVLTN